MKEDYTFMDDVLYKDGFGENDELHRIKIFGIGGCGNNAISHMINSGLNGPEFIAANSDMQDLRRCLAEKKIILGRKSAKGKGCGGDRHAGRQAAEEDIDKIKEVLADSDIVFLAAGLGGGTGSGGAPLVAEYLSKLDPPPLVVSVVVTPFDYESKRQKVAKEVIKDLMQYSHSIISISNAKLMEYHPKETFLACRKIADDVLYRAVSSITELIQQQGVINVDFADLKATLSRRGPAIMGMGEASGDDRALKALKMAISSPLNSDLSIKGAKGLLVNITADSNFLMEEFNAVTTALQNEAYEDCDIFTGLVVDESLAETGTLRVMVIATGLENPEQKTSELPQIIFEEEPEINVSELSAREDRPSESLSSPLRIPSFGAPQQSLQNQGQRVIKAPAGIRVKPLNPAAVTKYEEHQGVDPANWDSAYYDKPAFMRNTAD